MQADTVVLAGRHGELVWQVLVGGDDRELLTMLHVRRAGHLVVASGFGGPPLHPGRLVNEWRGRTDDLPYFVMARAEPSVTRVVAVTDRGSQVELATSAVVPAYGLRFGACGLPDGETPGLLRVATAGGVLQDVWTPV